MGAWGIGVAESDEFETVKAMFFDCFYGETTPVEQIESRILRYYKEQIPDEESSQWHDIYFALADCEHKCGCLSRELFTKVEQIVFSESNLQAWIKRGAEEATIEFRERELQKFLAKLTVPPKKPVKRKFKSRFTFPMKTGDVFACYSKPNRRYGCGVVLDVRMSGLFPWEEEYHFLALVALSSLTPETLPTVEQILSANVRDVFWNGGCVYNLPTKGFTVLDNLADRIDKDYSEYFGAHKIDDRIFVGDMLRPSFDELISSDESPLFPNALQQKPMQFFFRKKNLRPTVEENASER